MSVVNIIFGNRCKMKTMRVCIVPFAEIDLLDKYSLGAGYLASALEAMARSMRLPIEIEYLNDLDHRLDSPETIASEILKFEPDVVGLGLFVWSDDVAKQVSSLLKDANKDILVVGGGPWVSGDLVALAKEFEDFDCLIEGDAEFSFCEVVERFYNSRSVESLKGIVGTIVRENENLTVTGRKLIDPNAVPCPYGSFVTPASAVRLSLRRGCGMRCKYCNWGGGLSKPLSSRNVGHILEYAWSRNMGIWVVDAAINRRKQDLLLLASACREIKSQGLVPAMSGFIDYMCVDSKVCELLKECGYHFLEVGLQSVNQEVIKKCGRKPDMDTFERAISMLRDVGEVVVDIMLGLPEDTPESFIRTLEYLKSLQVKVHLFHLLGVTSSDYYLNPEKYGLVFEPKHHYLVSSPTFSEEDLKSCASYFVENYPWKGIGSDYFSGNPRFARFPYNYFVPYDCYASAHQKFGDPLPPSQLLPGSKALNVGSVVSHALGLTAKSGVGLDGFVVSIDGYSPEACRLSIKETDGKVVGFITVLKKGVANDNSFLVAGASLGLRYFTFDPDYESSVFRIADSIWDAITRWEQKYENLDIGS